MRKVSYDPLWKKLIDLQMTKTELQEKVGFSKSTLAKMRKNEYVALEVIERICNISTPAGSRSDLTGITSHHPAP